MGQEEQWDCESILSTYSNLYNHPTVLDAPKKTIKLSSKTGAPVGFVGKNRIKEEEESDEEGDYDTVSTVSTNLGERRPTKETKEEKRARKQAVKEARRNRRKEKKETKTEFKQ